MANRFRPNWLETSPNPTGENPTSKKLPAFLKKLPPRKRLIPMLLVLLGLVAFLYGASIGRNVFAGTTHFFYSLADESVASPTPQPPLPNHLPQVGTILYTVQEGDSCDDILTYQMHMYQAGEVFSDVKPETVRALGAALGQDCHRIQPGTVLTLSP